jgi:hypothetical protein
LTEQIGNTLIGGTLQVTSNSIIEWAGADIHSIAKGASVIVSGSGILRDIEIGTNALAGLQSIAGSLSVGGGSTISIPGSLSLEGTLALSSSGTVNVGADLILGGGAKFSGTITPTISNGKVIRLVPWLVDVSGNVLLDGSISLSLAFGPYTQLSLSQSTTLLLLDAGSIEGVFSNAPTDGAQVVFYDYKHSPLGTFDIHYGNTQVTLSNFVPIPEPSIWMLMLIGFAFVGQMTRRHFKGQ